MKTEHARIAEAVVAGLFKELHPGRQIIAVSREQIRNAVLRALQDYDKGEKLTRKISYGIAE